MYTQGTITLHLSVHTIEIPNTHFKLKCILRTSQQGVYYEEACHPKIACKSPSSCQQTLMTSFLLELGFQFNPSTFQLNLWALSTISKSWSENISAHLVNFHVNWCDLSKIWVVGGNWWPKWMAYDKCGSGMMTRAKQLQNIPPHKNYI
jgi:hypothetical protein